MNNSEGISQSQGINVSALSSVSRSKANSFKSNHGVKKYDRELNNIDIIARDNVKINTKSKSMESYKKVDTEVNIDASKSEKSKVNYDEVKKEFEEAKSERLEEKRANEIKESKISELYLKVTSGASLSLSELDYLARENPAIRNMALQVINEEEAFRRELEKAKTREEIVLLKQESDFKHADIIKEFEKLKIPILDEHVGIFINEKK
ncbi:MAG: hypothetical protein ACK5LT_01285 [Lachnospirales bacterium]